MLAPPSVDDAALVCDQIIASLANPASGPTYSVTSLAAALARQGAVSVVHTIGEGGLPGGSHRTLNAADILEYPGGGRLFTSRALRRALVRRAAEADVLHAHGLWLMPSIYPGRAAGRRGARARLVVSPRGMLGEAALQYSRLKKRVFWALLQERALQSADCLHATAPSEYDDIRRQGLRPPVAVVPNGIGLPDAAPHGARRGADDARIVLSLGRLHPKKGLDRLLGAWSLLEQERPDWTLRIVGPDENGHEAELRRMAASMGLQRVQFRGPVFGADKLAAYRDADIFVLPTRHENFAMTVAEALACETPVVSTKGAPWQGLETERCGWWVDHGPEPMAAALREAMAMPREALHAMGARGRVWMQRDFSWDRVARDMRGVYCWLAGRGPAPACVIHD